MRLFLANIFGKHNLNSLPYKSSGLCKLINQVEPNFNLVQHMKSTPDKTGLTDLLTGRDDMRLHCFE